MSRHPLLWLAALVACLHVPLHAQPAARAATAPTPATAALPVEGQACTAIPFASANAAAVAVPSAAGAWGGPRSGSEPTLSDRVVRYDIQATLDPVKHTIDGKQKLTWRNRSAQPVCAIYLHLYLNAFEGPGSTFMSEQRNNGFSFRSEVEVKDGDWGYIRLKRVAAGRAGGEAGASCSPITARPPTAPWSVSTCRSRSLPAPAPRWTSTSSTSCRACRHVPATTAASTWSASGSRRSACWNCPASAVPPRRAGTRTSSTCTVSSTPISANYDVRITVPKGYTVGATGEETGAPVERGGKVTHRYVQDDVHDFAWTADNRYAKPLEGVYKGPGSPQVQVRSCIHPEYASNAQPVLQATHRFAGAISRARSARIRTSTVTAVIPPHNANEAGGMEYPTFFTADNVDTVEADSPQRFSLDFVTIHEFGHGYFYGILGSNEFEEPHAGRRAQRVLGPAHDARRASRTCTYHAAAEAVGQCDPVAGVRDGAPWRDAGRLRRSARARIRGTACPAAATAASIRAPRPRCVTSRHESARRRWNARSSCTTQRWKFRHPSFADLREALAEGTGRRDVVERGFAQHVYATHKVDDSIDRFSSEEALPLPGYTEYKGRQVEVTSTLLDKAITARPQGVEEEASAGKGGMKARSRTAPWCWSVAMAQRCRRRCG